MSRRNTSRYVRWAGREQKPWQVVVTLVVGGSLFLAGLPLLLVAAAGRLEARWGLRRFGTGIPVRVAGVLLLVAGGALASWSVRAQVRVGRGTPVPMIPTRRLVVVAPFTFCRNPMILGTATAYLGLSVVIGSVAAVVLVTAFAGLLLAYVKILEEKELEARFGPAYVEYKRATPFLVPRRPRRSPT